MIPNEDSYMDLDPTVKDRFGIPVSRFHWKWSSHELNQALHAKKTFADLPTGRQTFGSVPFEVYDFPTSPVPTAVVLGGPGVPGGRRRLRRSPRRWSYSGTAGS